MKDLGMELDYLGSLVSSHIPEGRFKEWLRAMFWRRLDPLKKIEAIIENLEVMPDKTLRCDLKDGTTFYGLPCENQWMRLKYMDNAGRMGLFWNYGGMMSQLDEIYMAKIYERHYRPKEGDVVLDVGANMGMFTTRVAKMIGESGLVIAVEPDYRNVELLKRNIEANRLSNVIIVPKGAWGSKGAKKLNLFSGSSGLSSFYNSFFKDLGRLIAVEEVQVDTLDGISYDLGIDHVDFVKMDIEGAELEALEGVDRLSQREGLRMAIAAYHIVNGKVTCKSVMRKLRSLGLKIIREGAMVYGQRL